MNQPREMVNRLFIGIVIVALFILAVALAQGLVENIGGQVERLLP